MKIYVGSTEYTTLKDISFSPSADIVNDRLSIDEVVCDIVTENKILVGSDGWFVDEDENVWFHGYVQYAEEEQEHVVHVRIRSELEFLDHKIMPAEIFNTTVGYMLDDIFENTQATYYAPQSILSKPISGYCPEQTARERLQHVLFATGLYCRSSFCQHPMILELDTQNVTQIPEYKTYWKPTLTAEEYITSVKVIAYSFTQGTPTGSDEYVEVGGYKYIINRTEVTLNNPNVPQNTPLNELVYDSVYLVNNSNVSEVASMLALYYFNRQKVDFNCINCGEYVLGEKYQVNIHEGAETADYAIGYAESCEFSFGARQKSRMVIGACSVVELDKLTIEYIGVESGVRGMVLAKRVFYLPAGSNYEISLEHVSVTLGKYAYVFRPATPTLTGTKAEGAETAQVNAYIALRTNTKTRVLEIISVDSVERTQQGSGLDAYYQAEIE